MLVNTAIYRCYTCNDTPDLVLLQTERSEIYHCLGCLGRLKFIGNQKIEKKALEVIRKRQEAWNDA